jgi:thioredoxin reductase (NADPH)
MKKMIDEKEVAVIGLGPGGVTASIYLKRYGMTPFAFEKELVGGKVNKTEKVENYTGIETISGPDFGPQLENQLSSFDIQPIYKEVKQLSLNEDGTFHLVYGKNIEHDFKYVILASGLNERPFPINGQETFNSRGISRCAICDGPFYKGKDVAVVGAGTAAFEEATYLASIASSVTLIARRTTLRAPEYYVNNFLSHPNAKIKAPYEIIEAKGNQSLESIVIRNKDTDEREELNISGLFLYVGEAPNIEFIKIDGIFDEKGYIVTDKNLMTKVNNLYAVGDCRDTKLRQISTAVGDGALAASLIHETYQNK